MSLSGLLGLQECTLLDYSLYSVLSRTSGSCVLVARRFDSYVIGTVLLILSSRYILHPLEGHKLSTVVVLMLRSEHDGFI